MFIKKSFADEIAAGMEKHLIDNSINKLATQETQIVKAADYLNAAAEIFEDFGLTKQAEIITLVLETLAAKKSKKKAPKAKAKKAPKSKKKSKKSSPKAALKNPTSKEMVENLKEKGWVFNETGNHDEHDADDNCAMCGDMSYDDDFSYAEDEDEEGSEDDLQSMLEELKSEHDFEDEEDLRNPDTYSEEAIHPDYKLRDFQLEDPEYSEDLGEPRDPVYKHHVGKGPKFNYFDD